MNIKTLAQAILGLAVPVIGAHSVFSILLLSPLFAPVCFAEVKIPEGTKLRVRLEQGLSSATAEEGQTVELSVADAVKVGDTTLFAEGSRVTGTVTVAHEKRRWQV
jgi:hypothetical protein